MRIYINLVWGSILLLVGCLSPPSEPSKGEAESISNRQIDGLLVSKPAGGEQGGGITIAQLPPESCEWVNGVFGCLLEPDQILRMAWSTCADSLSDLEAQAGGIEIEFLINGQVIPSDLVALRQETHARQFQAACRSWEVDLSQWPPKRSFFLVTNVYESGQLSESRLVEIWAAADKATE